MITQKSFTKLFNGNPYNLFAFVFLQRAIKYPKKEGIENNIKVLGTLRIDFFFSQSKVQNGKNCPRLAFGTTCINIAYSTMKDETGDVGVWNA